MGVDYVDQGYKNGTKNDDSSLKMKLIIDHGFK